jgi:hypothetical protein
MGVTFTATIVEEPSHGCHAMLMAAVRFLLQPALNRNYL